VTKGAGVIGLDVGTSGCRAVAVDSVGQPLGETMVALPPSVCTSEGGAEQQPQDWWQAVQQLLAQLARHVQGFRPSALCLDATSATLLLCDPSGQPLGPARMYNDCQAREPAARIAELAPPDCAAHGASSSLAKLLALKAHYQPQSTTLALHQADWLNGCLTGRFGVSDWNNSLKMGFDPLNLRWPDWLNGLDLAPIQLPEVVAPGSDLGPIQPGVARALGLPASLRILAATTDSTAAVLAAGARQPGDAVTSLGSTLVVKILAETPVVAPEFGVYSHRFGKQWLVGGASNSGGAVLRQFFTPEQLTALSCEIDPNRDSGLDYYPLPGRGERFPLQDPMLEPRLNPRPAADAVFLHGLLEGIARIEQMGYRRLHELGAPFPRQVLTLGGGADNPMWARLRERLLGVAVRPAEHHQAAHGAARLALHAINPAGEHHGHHP
jgi:sugar (pentulose or hexulose) kinase